MNAYSHSSKVVVVADSRTQRGRQEDYRGPTQDELGVLADRVSEAEASMAGDVGSFVHNHPAVAEVSLPRDGTREDYHGPTQQELGVLADHVTEAEASMVGGVPDPPPSARSSPPVNLSLWEIDLSGPREVRTPIHDVRSPIRDVRRGRVAGRASEDSFLRQLDEVEASLRKKIDSLA
jgi:hypothetical protein